MPIPNSVSQEQALDLAVLMIDKGDFQGAIAVYSALIEQSPEYKFYKLRADAKVLFGDYPAALADLKEAEKLAQVEGDPTRIGSIRSRITHLEAEMSRLGTQP